MSEDTHRSQVSIRRDVVALDDLAGLRVLLTNKMVSD